MYKILGGILVANHKSVVTLAFCKSGLPLLTGCEIPELSRASSCKFKDLLCQTKHTLLY